MFGLAALALIAFGVFTRQRLKVTVPSRPWIMRVIELEQQNPGYSGKNLSAFHLLMFVEVASEKKPITLAVDRENRRVGKL